MFSKKSLMFAALLIIGFGGMLQAADIIVKADGSGNYTTIHDALAAATPGDVIIINDNAAYEGVNGFSGKSATIKAGAGFTPTFKVSPLNPGWYNSSFYLYGAASQLTFEGLKIVSNGGNSYFVYNSVGDASVMVTLKNCDIEGSFAWLLANGYAAASVAGATVKMVGCTIKTVNSISIMRLGGSDAKGIIDQCTFIQDPAATDDAGVVDDLRCWVQSWGTGNTITITNSIFIDSAGKLTSGIAAHELGTANDFAVTLDYCIYGASQLGPEAAITETATNSLTSDPRVNMGQYASDPYFGLLYGSPAIGAGNGQNGAVNIGAWQGDAVPVELSTFSAE